MNNNLNVEPQYRTMTIVWLALLVSQIIFLAVLFVIKPEVYKFDFSKSLLNADNSIMVIALGIVGISTFLLSFILRAKFIKQAIDEQKPDLVQTAMIIGCGLCESTSLFGFVLAMAFAYPYFFLWFALGILGIILHLPKRGNLIAASYKRS